MKKMLLAWVLCLTLSLCALADRHCLSFRAGRGKTPTRAKTPCADASVNSTGDELLTDDPLATGGYKYEIPLTSMDKAREMSKGSASVRVGIMDSGSILRIPI